MKFYLATSLAVLLGGVNAQVTTYPCPAAGAPPTVIVGSTSTSSQTVRIPIISAPDGLCTLVRRSSDGTKRAPVARSYSGRGWEVSAGRFGGRTPTGVANDASMRASVDCNAGGTANECDVTLPPLEDAGTQEYVLER